MTRRTLSMLGAMLSLVAVVALGLPVQPAGAARPSKLPDLQCGVVPTTDVVLRADLTCLALATGDWPPVTIDLGGHTLRLTAPSNCGGPWPICPLTDVVGVTILNGTIDGGVAARNSETSRPTTLRRVHVTGAVKTGVMGTAVIDRDVVDGGVEVGTGASIHGSTITGGVQIYTYIGGHPVDVVGNTIVGSAQRAAAALAITSVPEWEGNSWEINPITGTVTDNTIRGATGAGIRVSGQNGSATEIYSLVADLTVARNQVSDNNGDGIDVHQVWVPDSGGSGVTLRANIARRNGGHGIDATSTGAGVVSGLIDAGANRATGNALDPQCIGVTCGASGRAIPWVRWSPPDPIEVDTPLGPDQLDATANVPGTFTYSPPAGTELAAGSQPLSVHFEPDDSTRFSPVDRTVLLRVNPHQPQVTWGPQSIVYGTPLGPDQLDATANVPGTFTYTPGPGTLLQPGTSTLQVRFIPDDTAKWAAGGATVTIDVAFPPDETLTWNPPATITAGPLGPEALNATASVPGTFWYSPALGAVLVPGLAQRLRVDFFPTDPAHYVYMHREITVDVLPQPGSPGSVVLVPAPSSSLNAGLITDSRVADVDEDGTPDQITVSASGGTLFSATLRIATGLGDGTFAIEGSWSSPQPGQVSSYPLANGGHLVEPGDVDGDGHVDLVVSSRDPDVITVFLGNGDGTFRPLADQPAGAGLGGLVLADVNGDGHLDLVESNFFTPTVSVLLGQGDGTFASKVDYPVGAGPKRAAVVDLDGDGALDLVVPNRLTNTISVLDGRGDGTFDPARNIVVGHGPDTVATSDIDHDGHVDLLVSSSGDAKISILRGDGLGGFFSRIDVVTPATPTGIAIGDFDGDGEPDIAVACTGAASVVVWHGTGTTTLGVSTTVSMYDPGTLVPSDLDRDGRLDLLVGRTRALATDVLMNRTPPPT